MVFIKDSMYYRSLFYAGLMILFLIFGYLFLYNGFNTKTKMKVLYEDSSNINYKVNYVDNNYNIDGDKFVSNMVDNIEINYSYNNRLSEYVSGYYRYNVVGYLIAYEDNIDDSLWERRYDLVNDKSVVLDRNDINYIQIDDSFNFDFKRYRNEINEFRDSYDIDISGYFHIRINISEFLSFDSLDNEYSDTKTITIDIPITEDVFEISYNNIKDSDSYYEFTSNKAMNIIFLIIGAFCISMFVSLLVLVVKQFGFISKKQSRYNVELKRILSKYDDCIVRVNKFYVNKKYNMIYVDSFSELMDVYNKLNKMINFKEIKRSSEAIFVIVDGEDAWIYKMIAKYEE